MLVKYTYIGDANLDGIINGDDYFAIDAGYAAQSTGYAHGDFDYNGRIDADDYFAIDSHYNKASTLLAQSFAIQQSADRRGAGHGESAVLVQQCRHWICVRPAVRIG